MADVGNRLVDEVAQFATIALGLAERQDELALAKEDKKRAVEQIDQIKQMIQDLIAQREVTKINSQYKIA